MSFLGHEDQYTSQGLLESIVDNALDDGYYEIRPGRYSRSRGVRTVASGLALLLFAALLTVAAVQTRKDSPVNNLERESLIQDIDARKDVISKQQDKRAKLTDELSEMNARTVGTAGTAIALAAGVRSAVGPGLSITVAGSAKYNANGMVTDTDLQALVNGLWYAGAEAVAINGNRIGSLTSIRQAGSAITVNYVSLRSPYEVVAIGNSDSLRDRLAENQGGEYLDQRAKRSDLQYSVHKKTKVNVPALSAQRLSLPHATALEGDS